MKEKGVKKELGQRKPGRTSTKTYYEATVIKTSQQWCETKLQKQAPVPTMCQALVKTLKNQCPTEQTKLLNFK